MVFKKIGGALLLLGALNWGLIGIFNFHLIAWISGGAATLVARVLYILLGAGLLFYLLGRLVANRDSDEEKEKPPQ